MAGAHPDQLHPVLTVVEHYAVFKKNRRMLDPISLRAGFSGNRLVML